MADAPRSYKDPVYASLDAKIENKLGLPSGLLSSIRLHGERSNADQVSEAGARTVYQITGPTRDAVLKKYGIDAYLSPSNAAEVAGLLLKEGLDRNNGDTSLAAAEYHGGTNKDNWGPRTKAYVKRVSSGLQSSQDDALLADLSSWRQSAAKAPAASPVVDDDLISAAKAWKASQPQREDKSLLDTIKGAPGAVVESVTGSKRRTEEIDALPDWATMPELNQLSMASAKTGLGTLLSNPEETAQIIKSNFPDAQIRQDAKGNYIIRSAADSKEYAIKPGFRVSDIPRAIGAIAGFTPAGRAATIPGLAAGTAATQAVIEGTQAASGGEFNPEEVAMAGILGGAVPVISRAAGAAKDAVKAGLAKSRGAAPVTQAETQAVTQAAEEVAPAVAQAAPVEALTQQELAATAKKATGGLGSGRAKAELAEQVAPDQKTVEAAKRLGIDEYLQPDHVTTNQAYRELAQAAKSIPGSEARAQELAGLESVANRADRLIDEIGGTNDISALDASLKQRMQATHAELKAKAGKYFDEVRASVPAKSEASADNVLNMINARADELGGMGNLSSIERTIARKLTPKDGKQPSYALLDDVRRDLTAAKYSRQGPFKDADDRLISMLEQALRKDQYAAAEKYGMGPTWDLAQKTSSTYLGLQDDLASIFGKNIDGSIVGALSGAVKSLPTGDTSKLVRLLKAIPDDMRQEVVASGLNTAFAKNARNGNLNFNSYADWYEGLLRNKQAYTAIMSNLPQSARKQLSDLYRVSNGIRQASKERITTGRINSVIDQLKPAESLAGRLYDVAKHNAAAASAGTALSAVGLPGAGAAVASALARGPKPAAINAVDKIIASPEFVNLAKQAGTKGEKRATLRLVHSKPFKQFIHAAKNPKELSNREKWVAQALQANNQGRQ